MTLVNVSPSFGGYKSYAVDHEYLDSKRPIDTAPTQILLLSAYFELTNQSLTAALTQSSSWDDTAHGFIGAVYSNKFIAGSMAYRFGVASWFKKLCGQVAPQSEAREIQIASGRNLHPHLVNAVAQFESTPLNEDRAIFWRGWRIMDGRGKPTYLRLYSLHNRFGRAFTDQFYESCILASRASANDALPCVNNFAEFIANLPEQVCAEDFQNRDFVESLIHAFFLNYFQTSYQKGYKIDTIKRSWAGFALFLDRYVLDRIWAKPMGKTPVPPTRSSRHTGNIRVDAAGLSFKERLLTSVPLAATDLEAKELLFRQIAADHNVFVEWARIRVEQLRATRLATAHLFDNKSGNELDFPDEGHESLDRRKRLRACAQLINDRANGRLSRSVTYASIEFDLSADLGIPNRLDLIAYAVLLIAEHPAITPRFLEHLLISDGPEGPSCLHQSDNSSYLVGNKPRKGPEHSEQRIKLNGTSLSLVLDLEAATARLRSTLKAQGKSRWQRLFLDARSVRVYSSRFRGPADTNYWRPQIARELQLIGQISDDQANSLASRFTLSRLRASAGVLVYLRTGSPYEMAKALGHEQYCPSLLDRYLPKPIQQFFTDRWIRIFQSSIVCEAMADSAHLLNASGFSSMEEIDAFLRDHALKMPKNDEERSSRKTNQDCVIFNVSSDVLTVLFSVEKAVEQSVERACGAAKFWAEISQHLRPHLSSRPDLAAEIKRAESQANPSIVDTLIYA